MRVAAQSAHARAHLFIFRTYCIARVHEALDVDDDRLFFARATSHDGDKYSDTKNCAIEDDLIDLG